MSKPLRVGQIRRWNGRNSQSVDYLILELFVDGNLRKWWGQVLVSDIVDPRLGLHPVGDFVLFDEDTWLGITYVLAEAHDE